MVKNKKHKGFTLIEILVSLTLLGLIFLLLFNSLHTANKSWIAGEKKISQNDETRLAAIFIRRQLTHALPVMWINQKKQQLLFKGNEDQLSFASTLPAHRGGGGLNLITIKVEQQDSENKQLILEYQNINPDMESITFQDATPEQNKAILLSDIESIELNYFGSAQPNQPSDWHDDWTDQKNLPQLIRLQIHSSATHINWPAIDVVLPVEFIGGQPQFTIVSENEFPLT